jgi:hypothetical protein
MADIMHEEKAEQFLGKCLYQKPAVDSVPNQW